MNVPASEALENVRQASITNPFLGRPASRSRVEEIETYYQRLAETCKAALEAGWTLEEVAEAASGRTREYIRQLIGRRFPDWRPEWSPKK